MPRIVTRREAESDLLELFVSIGRGSIRSAGRFLQAVDRACELLASMPGMGSACESDEPALAGTRLWPIRGFRKYVIVYRPLDDGIEVLRVVRGSRDLEALFRARSSD